MEEHRYVFAGIAPSRKKKHRATNVEVLPEACSIALGRAVDAEAGQRHSFRGDVVLVNDKVTFTGAIGQNSTGMLHLPRTDAVVGIGFVVHAREQETAFGC